MMILIHAFDIGANRSVEIRIKGSENPNPFVMRDNRVYVRVRPDSDMLAELDLTSHKLEWLIYPN